MRLLRYASLFTLAAATPALADPALEPAQVEEVVVTATRLPSPLESTPGAYVVTAEEIEARGAVFAADVLDTIPGISFSRNGGFGGVSSVRQRGASSDKTLVLVDGVPLNDPSQPNGGFEFSSFELADIERIEVLNGPQGSLWGSDAIGGVISFTTRELDGIRAEAEGGSYGTYRGVAAIGRAEARAAYGLSVSGLTSDGISKAAVGSEDDGMDTLTVTANGRWAVGERLVVDGRVRWNKAEIDVDGYDETFAFADTADVYETETASGFLRARVADLLGFDHAFSVNLLESERNQRGGTEYAYEAERQVYRWQADRGALTDPWALSLGVEREDTAADLDGRGTIDLGATAAFAVARLRPTDRLTATVSARYDDPERYDGEATARASAAYELGGGFRISAAYGQGFKTPSISQAVCDFCFPDPEVAVELKPERAEGYEGSLAWSDDRFSASVTAYRLKVRDQIAYVSSPDFSTSRYENIDRTLSRGIEAQAGAELGAGFAGRLAYSYTDAEDRTTGLRLLRVPEHQGSGVLTWTGEKADAALTVRAEGEQADSDPSTFSRTDRDGFVTADLAGSYEIVEGVRLTARVENLADEDYQQALGYAEAGRSAYVGVRLRR